MQEGGWLLLSMAFFSLAIPGATVVVRGSRFSAYLLVAAIFIPPLVVLAVSLEPEGRVNNLCGFLVPALVVLVIARTRLVLAYVRWTHFISLVIVHWVVFFGAMAVLFVTGQLVI